MSIANSSSCTYVFQITTQEHEFVFLFVVCCCCLLLFLGGINGCNFSLMSWGERFEVHAWKQIEFRISMIVNTV